MPSRTNRFVVGRLISLVVTGLAMVSQMSGAASVGHGRLMGSTTARIDNDSNIFASNTETSDTIGTISGTASYVRDVSLVTLELSAGFDAMMFASHDNQNSIDPRLAGKVGYNPSDKLKFQSTVDFRRITMANETVNDRTKSNDLSFDAILENLFSEKLGFRAVGGYSQFNNLTSGYSDIESYNVGLHVVHIYSPKLKLLGGIAAVESWTSNRPANRRSPSNQDWRYTVGAEGELAPKITGEIGVGVVQRSFNGPGFDSTSTMFLSSRVTWEASEKTSWTLRADQNLGLSAADQSQKTSRLSLGLQQMLSAKLTLEGSVGVDHSAYIGFSGTGARTDDGTVLRGRMVYTLNNAMSVDFSLGYRHSDSTLSVSTYDRVNVGAGFIARF